MDMRLTDTVELKAAILVTGLRNGSVCIYRTVLAHAQPIRFDQINKFRAHKRDVRALCIHPTKDVLVSSTIYPDYHGVHGVKIKIWSIQELTSPHLIKQIAHTGGVSFAKYSPSGALLTGGSVGYTECFIHLYGVGPLYSLVWSWKALGRVLAIDWSPSGKRFAASFFTPDPDLDFHVRVWDSTFHVLYSFTHDRGYNGCYTTRFASDDLLISSALDNNLHSHNIPKAEVKTLTFPHAVRAVAKLSSEIVCASCDDNMLHIYKVYEGQLHLVATLPHNPCKSLVSCLCPYNNAGYVLASSNGARYMDISVTNILNWLREAKKIILNNEILPFYGDVHNIIFTYLI